MGLVEVVQPGFLLSIIGNDLAELVFGELQPVVCQVQPCPGATDVDVLADQVGQRVGLYGPVVGLGAEPGTPLSS